MKLLNTSLEIAETLVEAVQNANSNDSETSKNLINAVAYVIRDIIK